MKKIKILFTIPNFDTAGSGKALLNVASRINKDVFEVSIACMHNGGDFFKVVEQSGIPVHVIQFTTPMKPYNKGLNECYKISKQFKLINPDIIHSFHYSADYSEALSARLAGIKWIYTKKNMNWGRGSKNAWKIRTSLASAIAIQNTDMKEAFFSTSKKTVLIPRGVDVSKFQPLKRNSNLVSKWNIDISDRIFMCVANLVPVKGLEIVIHAFHIIHEKYPDWKLMIIGDDKNDYGIEMKTLPLSLGIANKVVFCGKQNDMVDYLNLAELVVLPTLNKGRKEGSPVALLEAMSCGKVVLGSEISGIKDQLQDFPEHLVEAGCIESWSEALSKQMLKTISENRNLGLQFREHVLKEYPIDKEVKKCEDLYLDCLKKIKIEQHK